MSSAKEVVDTLDEDIKIVSVSGDWELLYINGELRHEDHSIEISDVSRYVDGLEVDEEWVGVSVNGGTPDTYEELQRMKEVEENIEVETEVNDKSGMFVVQGVDVEVDVSVFRVTSDGMRRYMDEFSGVSPDEGILVEFDEDEDDTEDLSVRFNRIHNYSPD